jgi:D-threo-aldose 1-dehydrogenase
MSSRPSATLGFGCASLFGLSSRSERRAVLECAYDNGIRHFDVAPIYGLGQAEAELADFIDHRDDVSIGTKFGLDLTALGRFAGAIQPPVRRLLRSRPGLERALKKPRSTRSHGIAGRGLYSPGNYSVTNARRSLLASLRALRTDKIDYLFLHEPVGSLGQYFDDLADFLDEQTRNGTIRWWGHAGDVSLPDPHIAGLNRRATALQFPYDLFGGAHNAYTTDNKRTLNFGFLSEALPIVSAALSRDQRLLSECSELLNADLKNTETVVKLLVRDAMTHGGADTVLYSTTSKEHLESICTAARSPLPNEQKVVDAIRQSATKNRVKA